MEGLPARVIDSPLGILKILFRPSQESIVLLSENCRSNEGLNVVIRERDVLNDTVVAESLVTPRIVTNGLVLSVIAF